MRLNTAALVLVLVGIACGNSAEPSPTEPTTQPTNASSSTTLPSTTTTEPRLDVDFPLARQAPPPFDARAWYELTTGESVIPADEPGPPAEVGARATFVYSDGVIDETVPAELVYTTDSFAMWFADDVAYDVDEVAAAAERLETDVLPLVIELLGPIPAPGVDGDNRVALLHLNQLTDAVGEFASYDLLPASTFPDSNQREMLYIAGDLAVGSDLHLGTIVHELTHLIDYSYRQNRPLWMAEGIAQLAELATGFDTVLTHQRYLAYEPVQLNDWGPLQLDDRHYGSGYLAMVYLWEQYGPEAIRRVLESDLEGMAAIAEAVAADGDSLDGYFAGWMQAVATDHRDTGQFTALDLPRQCGVRTVDGLPYSDSVTTHQFAPRLFNLTGEGGVDVTISTTKTVGPIASGAAEGEWMWWAGPSDESAATLTRGFDLSGLSAATLAFDMWFDTGYNDSLIVVVSEDGGETWNLEGGDKSVSVEFADQFIGTAYTGWSGSAKTPSWDDEEIDLSHYAGSEILVQFQYLTDLYEARTGLAIDNISIVQLEETDGAESESEWEGSGFQRVPERVQQPWVAAVYQGSGSQPIEIVDGRGVIALDLSAGETATIAIAPTAPGTGVRSSFDIDIRGDATLIAAPAATDVETFDVPCSGWELERTPAYELVHANGGLAVTTLGSEGFTWSARSGVHDVVTVSADMTWSDGFDGAGGAICRLSEAGFYEVNIADDGWFLIGVSFDDQYEVLSEWQEAAAINQGEGAFNQFSFECGEGFLRVEANGEEIAFVEDDRLPPGQVALVGATYSAERHTSTYDNVTITPGSRTIDALLSNDDFEDRPRQWDDVSDRGSRVDFDGGEYVLDVTLKDWSAETYSLDIFEGVAFTADLRVTKAAPDALIGATCNADETGQYLFILAFDDSFTVLAATEDDVTTVVPWTYGSGLRIEPDASNRMHIECVDGRIFWSLNGRTLVDEADATLIEGRIGFLAYTYAYGRLEMRLDNVLIAESSLR